MQAYDLIMLVVLAMATIFGAIKGFAWQVASLASIVVSYLVSVNFRFDLAKVIQAAPPWNLFLAMLILYVATSFVIWVGFRLLSSMIDQVRLKEFDRHMGAAFGLAKGLIYCLLITMFAMTLLGPKQQEAICQSRSGFYIASALDNAGGVLPRELHDVVGPYLQRLDQKLHQHPEANSNPPAGTPWPNNWDGAAGAGPGAVGTGGGGLEQGSNGGWNFWPNGAAPQPPAVAPAPQNYPPLTLPPTSGSFSYEPAPGAGYPNIDAYGSGAVPLQAQQPGGGWAR